MKCNKVFLVEERQGGTACSPPFVAFSHIMAGFAERLSSATILAGAAALVAIILAITLGGRLSGAGRAKP